jgi:hypothetical protein
MTADNQHLLQQHQNERNEVKSTKQPENQIDDNKGPEIQQTSACPSEVHTKYDQISQHVCTLVYGILQRQRETQRNAAMQEMH